MVSLNDIVQSILSQLQMILHLMKFNIIYHHLIKLEDFLYKVTVMKYQVMIMTWWYKIRPIVYPLLYHNIHRSLFNNNNNSKELNFSKKYNHKNYSRFFCLFKYPYIYPCKSLFVFFNLFFDVRITIIKNFGIHSLSYIDVFVNRMQSFLIYRNPC